ncbi:isochorismatase family protein [Streptomyces profundus]|uniref:isochorismatase family protein n=1 Tax=Streptomyces profundus TaxID=2867410 RepID=UPI001D1652C9|nr:isochorismatase family protein [Streptomyces sp. MA3_2.13]UED83238.1 isochorismatase family protein [Streptomyces sp. MA3_2.13]
MAHIPPVAPYPLPAAHELPPNTAAWRPEPGRAVLLVHDMQRFFLRAFDGSALGEQLVTRVAALREAAAGAGVPVAYTAQPGRMSPQERGLLTDFWGQGMRAADDDRSIVEPLAPASGDWLFTKWRYSAFHRSSLLERMRAAGRDQLVVCGVYAHVGVLMTAVDAFSHDIEPFVAADAVADFSADHHRLALEYAAGRCAMVATTAQLVAWLGQAGASGTKLRTGAAR